MVNLAVIAFLLIAAMAAGRMGLPDRAVAYRKLAVLTALVTIGGNAVSVASFFVPMLVLVEDKGLGFYGLASFSPALAWAFPLVVVRDLLARRR